MPLKLYETSGFRISEQGLRTAHRPELEIQIVLEPVGDVVWRGRSRNFEQLRFEASLKRNELSALYDE